MLSENEPDGRLDTLTLAASADPETPRWYTQAWGIALILGLLIFGGLFAYYIKVESSIGARQTAYFARPEFGPVANFNIHDGSKILD